jgi:pyridoxine 5-phosphate synthase
MQDRDAFEIAEKCALPLNLEMGVTEEMLELALKVKPEFVCLVPETREEVTTEGGLDVAARIDEVTACVRALQEASIKVSLFIDPDLPQIEAAVKIGAEMVELHTGCFANAEGGAIESEVSRLIEAAKAAHAAGIQVNAGHGINYTNIYRLFTIPFLAELNIGHTIVSRAMRVGFREAVAEMKEAVSTYPG